MGHTYFDEEPAAMDRDEQVGQSQALAQLPTAAGSSVSTSSIRTPHCCGSVRVDFNQSDPQYIFKALYNPSTSSVAASVSNNTIKLYKVSGVAVELAGELRGHAGTISDLSFSTPAQPHILHSSSTDGTVRGWDARSGQQTEEYVLRGAEVFSFSMLEHVLAAGSNGSVVFWDRRAGSKPLAQLDDTHMDDVTQVKFHTSGRVLSASVDGLVAVHDVAKSFNDDDVFMAALNVSTSVEELGLYGPSQERAWVRTGTESLHLWEWWRACSEDVEGGDVPFAEWGDARGAAAAAAAGTPLEQALQEVGYLVGCHYDGASQQLLLIAGSASQEGAVALLPITEQRSTPAAPFHGGVLQPPVMALQGAHSSVVRSVQFFGDGTSNCNGPFCVTGGEDAFVCLWSLAPHPVGAVLPGHTLAARTHGGVGMASSSSGGGGGRGGGGVGMAGQQGRGLHGAGGGGGRGGRGAGGARHKGGRGGSMRQSPY